MNRGYRHIWLQAHSYGCNKVALYSAKTSARQVISGSILISPSVMYENILLDAYRKEHVLMERKAKELMKRGDSRALIDHLLWGSELLSAGAYISLFSPDPESNIFPFVSMNGWSVVNRIGVPVLAISGTRDDGVYVDQDTALRRLMDELVSAPAKDYLVLEGADHSFDVYGLDIAAAVVEFVRRVG